MASRAFSPSDIGWVQSWVGGGRPPSCLCGMCPKCKNRTYVARWRAKQPKKPRFVTSKKVRSAVGEANSRAAEIGLDERLTSREVAEILEEYDFRCAYCLGVAHSLDHVQPLAKGGSNSRENIVPACTSCNYAKGRYARLVPHLASRFWPPNEYVLEF